MRAAAVYAANDTYYACTNEIKSYNGADRLRLTVTNTVANAGNVTFKVEISHNAEVYSVYASDIATTAMVSGGVYEVLLPVRFCAGDGVRLSFKASSGATSAKIEIAGLFYLEAPETVVTARTTTTTSADDGSLVLVYNDTERQVVNGSGSNYEISLPDATTCTVGQRFEIVNAGSNFVPVKNSGTASSVFELLGPGCTLTAFCTSISTAAGTWVLEMTRPARYREFFSDLDSAGASNSTPDFRIFLGTGSSTGVGAGTASNRWGALQMALGTDAGQAGYINIWSLSFAAAYNIFNLGYPTMYRSRVDATALSDGTDTYLIRLGCYDVSNGTQPTNGVYFETDADGDIIPICRSGGTQTTIAAGGGKLAVASDVSNSHVIWVCNSAGSRVDFWVNMVYVGSITTNIPKTVALATGVQVSRSAGTTARTINLDLVNVQGGVR
jgi:hypothetical protein